MRASKLIELREPGLSISINELLVAMAAQERAIEEIAKMHSHVPGVDLIAAILDGKPEQPAAPPSPWREGPPPVGQWVWYVTWSGGSPFAERAHSQMILHWQPSWRWAPMTPPEWPERATTATTGGEK